MTTIGIIGAGHIGSTLAQGLIGLGHDVVISNSRGPESLAELIAELGPKAQAATPEEAAAAGEWAIVTVPMKSLDAVAVEQLGGRIVRDTCNYYWERDGRISVLDENETTTSEMVQAHLPSSRIVKAFNHIRAAEILTDGTPAGTENRRALATASEFPEAIALVTEIYDAFGLDTVNVGPLSESWRVERDRPAYAAARQNASELTANLAVATR
mgnify:FL=1